METKTIRISFAGAKIVKNQATRLGKSQVVWINQAVEFINKTGFDIFDFEKTKSQSVEDRIISFIKKREQKYFDPMEQYFLESKDLLSKVLKNLNDLGIVDLLDIEDKIVEEKTSGLKSLDSVKDGIEIQKENTIIAVDIMEEKQHDFEKLKLDNARLKNENDIYRKELKYLVDSIKPGGAMSSAKFVINIISNDINRIKKLIRNDNEDS